MTNEPNIREGKIEPIRAGKIPEQALGAGVALRDVRCGKCQKLLFRGTLLGEIKCRGCGHMNRF